MEINEQYLTKNQVKEYTKLSAYQINNGIRSGQLQFVFVGKKHLFKKQWVDNWLSMKGGAR
jgi:excisionase family DNA binding protein